jgi:hypothetical protein
MNKGQLETSYQWIFVLLAGGAFLLMFGFGIRGCAQTGELAAQSGDLRYVARTLSLTAWQPNTYVNISFPETRVSCQGTIILSTADDNPVRQNLDGVPAFLSTELEGPTRIVTSEILFSTTPKISTGTVLYGLDEDTTYIIVKSGTLGQELSGKNVLFVDSTGVAAAVAKVDGPVIVASTAVPDSSVLTASSSVTWVQIDPVLNTVKFSKQQSTGFGVAQQSAYFGSAMLSGALVAGEKSLYECGKKNAIARTRVVLRVAQERAEKLSRTPGTCGPLLLDVSNKLKVLETNIDDDLFMKDANTILQQQRVLYERGCAVIA